MAVIPSFDSRIAFDVIICVTADNITNQDQIRILNFEKTLIIFVTHQCYYCNHDFKSRTELYDHVATHVKTRKGNFQKTDNSKPKIEIKDNDKKNALTNIQLNIDRLTKKIEELHEKIEAHTKNQ